MKPWVMIFSLVAFLGCATAPPPSPSSQKTIPLTEANLEMVFEENEGMEINPEDAKEIRDFYRAGVQKKALAEKRLKDKIYPEAVRLYEDSSYLFAKVLQYIEEDAVGFPCFEGTNILFFPNLLSADNHLKVGKIQKAMGRENPAQRNWKKALDFAHRSLRFERTEWGLAVQREILSLLPEKK